MHKADLFKLLTDVESEITTIASSLGDCVMFSHSGKWHSEAATSQHQTCLRGVEVKEGRESQRILKMKSQISQICAEIAGCRQCKGVRDQDVDQCDMSMKKLGNSNRTSMNFKMKRYKNLLNSW
ncbi:hypothetical protein OROHE_014443 [Orobanche hederae]